MEEKVGREGGGVRWRKKVGERRGCGGGKGSEKLMEEKVGRDEGEEEKIGRDEGEEEKVGRDEGEEEKVHEERRIRRYGGTDGEGRPQGGGGRGR